jgi:hypothetical protein
VAFCAGCASAFLWLSLGTYGLPVTLILVALIVRLNAAVGMAGLLAGAGTFIVATTAIATARCDAFNSATSSCKSFGATEFLVLGAALVLIGAGLTLRIARASRLTERR